MQTIWKYETPILGKFTLNIPKGAEILTIQIDKKTNSPVIWAIVDDEAPLEERYFELYGTGHKMHTDIGIERKYIGTYQLDNGAFVGHIFERIN